MRSHLNVPRVILIGAIVLLPATVAVTGCFNPFDPSVRGVGVTDPAPAPNSPGNVLLLLQWCYENRAIFEYTELFDNDYRFVFGQRDPDGNAYRSNPWTRVDEVESTTHLFQGGDANQPAATSIALIFDRSFRLQEDPYHPGSAHKLIRTAVNIKIVADGEREISGFANFFLVRGDSAAIPEELTRRGFQPDPNRWYILRHEDDTFQEEGVATAPTSTARPIAAEPAAATASFPFVSSWGALKLVYR